MLFKESYTRLERIGRWSGDSILWLLAATMLLVGNPASLYGQGKKDGLVISVTSLDESKDVNLIEAKVKHAVVRQDRKIETIIFDFNPQGSKSVSSNPWVCLELKEFIDNLRVRGISWIPNDIHTVAFVHGGVSQHSLLPVLACNEIVISEAASLGPIKSSDEVLPKQVDSAYADLKKIDAEILGLLKSGNKLTASEAQKERIAYHQYFSTPREVVDHYDLLPTSLRENWLAGRIPVVAVIPLRGAVNKDKLSSLQRRIKSAIRDGRNLVILELDSQGGDVQAAALFTEEFLNSLTDRDGNPLTTIAYVPPGRSLGAATFLAVACSEIIMGEDAVLGDFAYLEEDADKLEAWGVTLAEYAKQHHYPPLLFQATIDPKAVVYDVVKNGRHRLVSADDFEENRDAWDGHEKLVKNNEKLTMITAPLARKWNVAGYTGVNSREGIYERYDIESSQVRVYRVDWLDNVAEFFRHPVVKLFLLLIGITGLILEVKIPGFGLPGIIGALCFVLFFWSHSFINQFTMLGVLLFVLGIVLLALEIFVVPGFGITGISGLLLVAASVVFVMMEKIPDSPQDWEQLGWSLGTFCLSVAGAIGLAIAIASFLPQIPYANRLMLSPPEDHDETDHPENVISERYAAMLGAIGITETPLRPAGKARFSDEYLDVVSEGDYINPGSRVQVIEIEGTRIVVKQV